MTVADLTPVELVSIIIMTNVVCAFGLLGLREWRAHGLETKRQKFVAGIGLFAIFGIPTLIGLRLMGAH